MITTIAHSHLPAERWR